MNIKTSCYPNKGFSIQVENTKTRNQSIMCPLPQTSLYRNKV
jgi:hypothetical protein